MARRPRRWASLYVLIAIVVVMGFPGMVFPRPHPNDGIVLADLEWPLVVLEVILAVIAYAVYKGPRGALIRAGLAVNLCGDAVVMVIGLLAFGNLSDDRFAPLVFFPPVLASCGLAGAVVAVAAGHRYRPALLRGAGYGAAMSLFFGAWTLTRGAKAWLQAPYGFDILLLLGVLGVGVVVLGTSPNLQRSIIAEPPARKSRG